MSEQSNNESKRLKGIVVFFVNLYPDLGQDIKSTMSIYKEMSKNLIDNLTADGRYVAIFAPVHREATRIEKVDFDAPFPRFNPSNEAIIKTVLRPKKKNKKIFDQQEEILEKEESFLGFISLFINFHPEVRLDVQDTINLIKEMNADSIDAIGKDGRYTLLIVPTTKEGSRVQKVDFDSPFPRFAPKATNQKKIVVVKGKLQDDDGLEEDQDLEDENDIDEDIGVQE